MRHFFLPIIYLTLFFSGPCGFLEALEIELTGGINNTAFDPEVYIHSAETTDIPQFESFPCIIGDFSIKNDISNVLGYNINIARDSILQNSLTGKMKVNTENINLEFGVFFGINDDFTKPDLGILGGIELVFPGAIFLSVNGSTSLGFINKQMGNNNRETAGAKFGFWLPNLLPVFSADIKAYTREEEDALVIRDELIRFMFSADIFAKNFPLTICIGAGYDILTRFYESDNYNNIELKAMFAGLDIKWQMARQFRFIAGFEMPVYIFEPAENKPEIFNLFKAHGGFALTFF